MPTIRPILAAAALALVLGTPAAADNGKTPPGNPCGDGPGRGTGNPCNGNNGNGGRNGNAGGGAPFEFENIAVPAEEDRGVFVSQIGSGNRAEARQRGARSYARVAQSGDDNSVDIDQDDGDHYVRVAQDGSNNALVAGQEGTGQSVLMLAQQGTFNRADVSQTESGTLFSAAAISQSGNGNLLNLVQDGSDNQARLIQEGDGNAMTATQIGDGNRLAWTQQGSGLADLQVTQEGGQSMQITQTNGGGN